MNISFQVVFALAMHVSVLAVVALLIARLLRPAGASSRWLACSAIAVIAASTVLAVLPTPKLGHLVGASQHPGEQLAQTSQSRLGQKAEAAQIAGGSTGLSLDLAATLAAFERILQTTNVQPPERTFPVFAFVVCVLCGIGATRFLLAWRSSRHILGQCEPITETGPNQAAQEAAAILGMNSFLCWESDVIEDAAVVGVWPPRVVLPSGWRCWTDAELRTVIAHEAAHLCNRDSVWRLLACVIETVHFYNPLVRMLTKRLAFIQEAAADKLAARIVGPKIYVRSLSSLALGRDAKNRSSCAGMNPVFSGYLIRRIEMLRTPLAVSRSEWRLSKFLAAGAMVLAGGVGYMARAYAVTQEPDVVVTSDDEPVARVASRKSVKNLKTSPIAGMFGRERTNPDLVPENNDGLLKVRFSDVFEQFNAGPLVGVANSLIAGTLKSTFESPELPSFDMQRINLMLGSCQLGLRYHPEKEEKHSLTMGVNAAEFHMDGPVDVGSWMQSYVPAAKEVPGDGFRIFELPEIPAIGPYPIPIAQKNDSTVICFGGFMPRSSSVNAAEELDGVIKHQEAPNNSAWSAAFQRIDGGIIAAVATNANFDPLPSMDESAEELNTAEQALLRVQASVSTVAFGADISDDGEQIGVRIEFACDDLAKADIVTEAVEEMVQYGLDDNASLDHSELGPRVGKQFLTRSVVRRAKHQDVFTVCFETSIDNPNFNGLELAQWLASQVKVQSAE